MINIIADDLQLYRDSLHPFIYQMAVHIKPLLHKLDQSKLSCKSRCLLDEKKSVIDILLEPSDNRIPYLDLHAEESHYTLGYADSEITESHSRLDESEWICSFAQLYEHMEKYFSGITIIEHYNKNRTLLKKEYFWGLHTEKDPSKLFGVMNANPIANIFTKEHHQVTFSHRFFL